MTLATLFFHRKLGVIAGLCFVGVAFTPWNLYLAAHNHFVMWAFRTFLEAVLIYGIAILGERALPKPFAFTFLAFAILLAAYVLLLTFGPSPKSRSGSPHPGCPPKDNRLRLRSNGPKSNPWPLTACSIATMPKPDPFFRFERFMNDARPKQHDQFEAPVGAGRRLAPLMMIPTQYSPLTAANPSESTVTCTFV